MTRGKWAALAVGIAVIAILVPFFPALWRGVAYVEERIDDFYTMHAQDSRRERPACMILLRKRFQWLPGPDAMTRCAWCVQSDHLKCPRQVYRPESPPGGGGRRLRSWDNPVPGVLLLYECTCPHPSHAQESE